MKNLKTSIKIQENLQIDGSKQNQNKLFSVECIPSKMEKEIRSVLITGFIDFNLSNDEETQESYHSDEASRS